MANGGTCGLWEVVVVIWMGRGGPAVVAWVWTKRVLLDLGVRTGRGFVVEEAGVMCRGRGCLNKKGGNVC